MRLALLLLLFTSALHAQQTRLMVPSGHSDEIKSVSFSPDKKRMITSSKDQSVRIWEVETGLVLEVIKFPGSADKHDQAVSLAQYSADGEKILIRVGDKYSIWNKFGKFLYELKYEPSHLWLTGDGKKIFMQEEGWIRIVDINNGKSLAQWKTDDDIEFSENEKLYAAIYNDSLRYWDRFDGRLIRSYPAGVYGSFQLSGTGDTLLLNKSYVIPSLDEAVTFQYADVSLESKASPSFQYIASWNIGELVTLVSVFDVQKGEKIIEIPGIDQLVDKVEFSKDEELLYISYRGHMVTWNIKENKRHSMMPVSTSTVLDPTGRFLYMWGDSLTTVWDIKNDSAFATLPPTEWGIFFPDDTRAVFYSNLIMTMSENFRVKKEFGSYTSGIFRTAYHPLGKEAVFLTGSNRFGITDLTTGQIKKYYSTPGITSRVNYSRDGKYLLAGTDQHLSLIDRTADTLVFGYSFNEEILTVDFSDDLKEVLVTAGRHLIRLNISDTAQNSSFTLPYLGWMYKWQFNASKKLFLTHFGRFPDFIGVLKIWDDRTKKELYTKEGRHVTGVRDAVFNKDGTRIAYSSGNYLDVIDAITGKVIFRDSVQNTFMDKLIYSHDGNILFTNTSNGIAWDSKTGKRLFVLKGSRDARHTSALFSTDDKFIYTIMNDTVASIWDAKNGQLVQSSISKQGAFASLFYSPGNEYLYGNLEDRSVTVRHMNKNEHLYDLYAPTRFDLLYKTPEGYYMAAPDATEKLYYVTPSLEVITFKQLDVKFNRPDHVLSVFPGADTSLIRSYKNAYLKRISKLQVDTTMFTGAITPPVADFEARDMISYEQNQDKLQLRIKGSDSKSQLMKFNLWLNEVPLFGMQGISLRSRNTRAFDTTLTINLSAGENLLETSVVNVNGIESYRQPLRVNFRPAVPVQVKTWFIGIGINKFKEPGHELNWSVKDIRDLSAALDRQHAGSISIDTLFDEQVTAEAIKGLKAKLLQTGINDRVIISYSGHGLLSDSLDYFLSTYEVNFKNPQIGGLRYNELENLLNGIPARKKLLLIDACHSGEVDKEEMEKYEWFEKTAGDSTARSNRRPVVQDGKLGIKNSFELMQELFVNVGLNTGTTVISAAAGTQFAQESAALQNGVFTYAILELMKMYPEDVSVSYLKWWVNVRVSELTKGMQVPNSRSETKTFNWRVW